MLASSMRVQHALFTTDNVMGHVADGRLKHQLMSDGSQGFVLVPAATEAKCGHNLSHAVPCRAHPAWTPAQARWAHVEVCQPCEKISKNHRLGSKGHTANV